MEHLRLHAVSFVAATGGLCLVIIYYQEYNLKDLLVQSARSGTDQSRNTSS